MDVSAGFGVPLVRERLRAAAARAREFVLLRVPSRSRWIIEFVSDVDLSSVAGAPGNEVEALVAAAAEVLGPEDFSDWERAAPGHES